MTKPKGGKPRGGRKKATPKAEEKPAESKREASSTESPQPEMPSVRETERDAAQGMSGLTALEALDERAASPTAASVYFGDAEDAEDAEWDPLDDFFVAEAEHGQGGTLFAAEDAKQGHRGGIDTVELLAFWVDNEEYAVDIVAIQEIIKLPDITPVPRVPASVLGIISLRGTIVPVLDLRAVLHLETKPPTRASRILVLRGSGDPVGLLVDSVTSVVRLDNETIEPTPRTMERVASEHVSGVGRIGERMLIVLDAGSVLVVMERAA